MVDENESKDVVGSGIPEDVPQPAGAEPAGGAAVESGPDRAADAVPPPDAVMLQGGGSTGSAKTEGGGIKRWYAEHKMLTGVGIGALAAVLVAGIFFIGYFVGKPCDESDRRVPVQQFQDQGPMRPDLRSTPSPGSRGDGRGRLDVLIEYREEIDDVIAGELGISTDELQDELEAGKTIAEIAEEKGVSGEDLAAALAAEINKIADGLAADGEITDEQAENMKSNAEALAERYIERGRRLLPVPSE